VPVQGVYVLHDEQGKQVAGFVPIQTGITGATDIQVTGGLTAGQTIVTGRYKILRNLRSGTIVKPDNTVEVTADSTS
jgi:HlyD family secretion protein